MKKVKRILFGLITLLSLLSCLASLGLWVRSETAGDAVCHWQMWNRNQNGQTDWNWKYTHILSVDGRLLVTVERGNWPNYGGHVMNSEWVGWHGNGGLQEFSRIGLAWEIKLMSFELPGHGGAPFVRTQKKFSMPYSIPTVLFCALPLTRLIRLIRRMAPEKVPA